MMAGIQTIWRRSGWWLVRKKQITPVQIPQNRNAEGLQYACQEASLLMSAEQGAMAGFTQMPVECWQLEGYGLCAAGIGKTAMYCLENAGIAVHGISISDVCLSLVVERGQSAAVRSLLLEAFSDML